MVQLTRTHGLLLHHQVYAPDEATSKDLPVMIFLYVCARVCGAMPCSLSLCAGT